MLPAEVVGQNPIRTYSLPKKPEDSYVASMKAWSWVCV